jgi:hypothetical protein
MSHPKDTAAEEPAKAAPEPLDNEALDEVVGGKRSEVKDAHDKYANP